MHRSIAATVILVLVFSGPLTSAARAGDITISPYGFVLFNAGRNTHIGTDLPVKASPADSGKTRSSLMFTARQTRLGLRIKSEADGWTIGGVTEVDFWGQKGSFNNGASMQSAPRLRLAYLTLLKHNLQLLFGQDWSIFAPLSPSSLAHVSIPPLSGSGNLWNRLPQVRVDYTSRLDSTNLLLMQIAVARPIASDATNDSQAELLGAGEYGGLPFVQGRVAYTRGQSITVGISTHAGQSDWQKAYPTNGYADDKTTTWGAAVDLKVTVHQMTLNGEAFTGSNLPMMFSNAGTRTIARGIPGTDSTELVVDGVKVRGGWGELAVKPTHSKFSFNGGAGLEVSDKNDVKKMVQSVSPQLSRNLTVFGNVQYEPLPKVAFAAELGYIRTSYMIKSGSGMTETNGTNWNATCSARMAF